MYIFSYGDPSVLHGYYNREILMAGRRKCDDCYYDCDDCERDCRYDYCLCEEDECDTHCFFDSDD